MQVQDIMTPRTDFDCLPSGAPVIDVVRCILDTGHSRLPIYRDTRDNIIGIAYAKDLLELLIDPPGIRPRWIRSCVSPSSSPKPRS